MNTQVTPQLRFPGFINPWISKNLLSLSKNGFSNGVFNDPAKVGSGYKLINVKDMYIDGSILDENLTLVAIGEKEFSKNKVEYGDIFFTRSSLVKEGIAYSNIYLGNGEDITYDGHLIRMQPYTTKVDPIFLNYLLTTSFARKQLVARGTTTTMTTIGQREISTVRVMIPELSEQKRITDFLSSVDKKIAILQQKKRLLELYKLGTMQSILFQKKRFINRDGKNYPDWEERSIGDVAKFINGYTFKSSTYVKDGQFKVITIANVQSGKMSFERVNRVNSLPKDIQKQQVLNVDDILISMTGNVGRVCRVTEDKCLLNQRVGKVVPANEISGNFLYYILSDKRFIVKMMSLAQGGAQDNLSMKDIMKYRFQLPTLAEQEKIANCLSAIDEKINLEEYRTTMFKQLKKALLQKLFI